MQKIILVSEYFPPQIFGGGEISAYLLAKALVDKGLDIHVLTSSTPGTNGYEIKDGIKIYRRLTTGNNPRSILSNITRKLLFPPSVKEQLELLENEIKPDVIHFLNTTSIVGYKTKTKTVATINSYGNFCPKGNLWYKDTLECPVVFSCDYDRYINCLIHSQYTGKVKLKPHLKYNPFFWYLSYRNYKKRNSNLNHIDEFIVPSEFVKQLMISRGIGKPIHKIPNIVDITKDTQHHQIKYKEVTILYTGALEKIKGVDMLIRAFNKIEGKDIELIIVGDGSEKDNLLKISDNRTRFIQNVPYISIPSIHKQADIVVLPSRWSEPLSRVLLEATCYGNPIIATDVGGNSEGVEDGRNGFLVNSTDEMWWRLDMLIMVSELRRGMGEESRKMFRERFGSEKIIGGVIDVYRKRLPNLEKTDRTIIGRLDKWEKQLAEITTKIEKAIEEKNGRKKK